MRKLTVILGVAALGLSTLALADEPATIGVQVTNNEEGGQTGSTLSINYDGVTQNAVYPSSVSSATAYTIGDPINVTFKTDSLTLSGPTLTSLYQAYTTANPTFTHMGKLYIEVFGTGGKESCPNVTGMQCIASTTLPNVQYGVGFSGGWAS